MTIGAWAAEVPSWANNPHGGATAIIWIQNSNLKFIPSQPPLMLCHFHQTEAELSRNIHFELAGISEVHHCF